MVGRTISHFKIIAPLGAGGMGCVYLAEDLRLGRRVALKLLPDELANNTERIARFRREAKILATVSHPGIVSIFSVEEAEGLVFFAMELVEGEPLTRLIPANGLSEERVLTLGSSLADALGAAHHAGVTHRDLKPGNLMVTADDRVKILDFGLAKPIDRDMAKTDATETEPLTQEGMIVGTIPYMAPEQLTGGIVDERADIFSLGAVLYEMCVGRRPFRGDSAADIVSSILRDQPKPLRRRRPDISQALADLVHRCLAKTPADRPGSAAEVRDRLLFIIEDGSAPTVEAPVFSTPDTSLRSIAVLPFKDMSPDGRQKHLCEGIAEELIHVLNGVPRLRVVSRAMSFLIADKALDPVEIGRRLEVDAVLEGAIRRQGKELRITAQLVDAVTGHDHWSKRFDRRAEDILRVEDEIATEIAETLRFELASGQRGHRHRTRSARAYDYYLRGRGFFNQYRSRAVELASELFERAINVDESYALAYAGAAECSAYLYLNADRDEAHLHHALELATRALEIDPDLPEAHVACGIALSYAGRTDEADVCFQTAIRMAPRLFDARLASARHLFTQGRLEEAAQQYAEAEDLRRDDYQVPLLAAQIYEDLQRPEEAAAARRRGVDVARRQLELNPDDTRALYMGANGLVGLGELDEGLEWAGRARHLEPDEPMLLYNLACIYSMAGDIDEAIDCLSTCLARGFTYRDWIVHDSNLTAIRADSRYLELAADLDRDAAPAAS